MTSLNPYDLISSHAWQRVVFTTYALSLSFFEAVVLDALTRGKSQDATIFADVAGIRAALGEQGARRAGRDYQIEPFSVERGVFHPKIAALIGGGDCHLLVGSGNLTFGGWGGNLEVLEHLHPSFAADAFDDAAEFFQLLAGAPNIRHGARRTCEMTAQEITAGTRGAARTGSIRLLHSLNGSISNGLTELVDGLGGATRLLIASPYWSAGTLDRMCGLLGLPDAYVHAHGSGTVKGNLGTNWPSEAKCLVHPVRAEPLVDSDASRPLHAKVFEIICKKGRIILSGSANATFAALGPGLNVEACVARIQRDHLVGWSTETAPPLALDTSVLDEPDSANLAGVLRAVLIGDEISADILVPAMEGRANVYQITGEGPQSLGSVEISSGSFAMPAPNLEIQSWKGGRLILRVEQENGKSAEGFISVSSYSEIRRRVGLLAPRLFALLSGNETPADVAAIMSWFHEDPSRMLGEASSAAGSKAHNVAEESGRLVPVSDLTSVSLSSSRADHPYAGPNEAAWKRFMDNVFAAFRTHRKSIVADPAEAADDDEEDRAPIEAKTDPAIAKSLAVFDRLLDLMLSTENRGAYAMVAFDMAQYVASRLRPEHDQVRAWWRRLTREIVLHGVAPERLPDAAASVLAMRAISVDANEDDRSARLRLLRLGVDLTGSPPDKARVAGFLDALEAPVDLDGIWHRLQAVRSMPEQAAAYLRALKLRRPTADYPDLPVAAREAWPTLQAAITDEEYLDDIITVPQPVRSCPKCYRALPTGDAAALVEARIVVARDCCGRILVCEGL